VRNMRQRASPVGACASGTLVPTNRVLDSVTRATYRAPSGSPRTLLGRRSYPTRTTPPESPTPRALGNAPQLFPSTRSPYRPPNSIAAGPVTGMAEVVPMQCERDAWIAALPQHRKKGLAHRRSMNPQVSGLGISQWT
jgi:hypothetical protein